MSANNATIVQIRRGNTAQTAAYTGALAELIVDTDQNTIVVQDGTTQGGNYLISKSQFNANVSYLLGIDGVQNTAIQVANTTANNASANTIALQGAMTSANANIVALFAIDNAQNNSITNTLTFANSAYNQANIAYIVANNAYNLANTESSYTFANAAFNTANSAQANTIALQGAMATANANIAYILAVDVGQNTAITNTTTFANGAYNTANSVQANTIALQGGLNTANANIAYILGVDIAQNTAIASANSMAFGAAATANTKLPLTGGTLTGDLVVNANLTVTGTTFYANTQMVDVANNNLILNASVSSTTTPTQNVYVTIDRGNQANSQIIWNESQKNWQLNNGTTTDYVATYANTISLQGGLNTANANIAYILSVDLSQNTAILSASANTIALQGGLNTANANIAYILSVDLAQNTAIQVANNTANIANARAYSTVLKAGDTMTGFLQITGATSNVIVQQSSLAQDIANTFAHAYTMGLFTANTDQSTQVGIQNFANTANSSTDLALYNNLGTDTNNFIDMGITSTSYNVALNGFTAAQPGDSYLYSNGVNLLIGTQTVGKNLKIFVGGYNASNVAATFNAPNTASSSNTTGTLVVTGGVGVTGNISANSVYTNGLYYANGTPFSTGSSITLSDSITSNSSANAATSNAVYQAIQAAVAQGLALSIALG
jgi:hypothetical protein